MSRTGPANKSRALSVLLRRKARRKPNAQRQRTELLIFFLLHPQGVGREQVLEALWPETDPDEAAEKFWRQLGDIRRSLRTIPIRPLSSSTSPEISTASSAPTSMSMPGASIVSLLRQRRAMGCEKHSMAPWIYTAANFSPASTTNGQTSFEITSEVS